MRDDLLKRLNWATYEALRLMREGKLPKLPEYAPSKGPQRDDL